MIFTHRTTPERTATITHKEGSAYLVQHTDAKGKARRKTFRNGYMAALRFVLNKEGYIVRAPQEGPVRWMTKLLQPYTGELYHAVDGASGAVWIADANDQLHRVTPGTCDVHSVPLNSVGSQRRRQVAVGADGAVWVLAPWSVRVDGELQTTQRLVRVSLDDAIKEVLQTTSETALTTLSTSTDAHLLGPSADGVALYAPDGTVLQTWSIVAASLVNPEGRTVGPIGAISEDGQWIAWVQASHITRVHRPTGDVQSIERDLKTISSIQLANDGTLFASGFRYPSHGTYRYGESVVRVSQDTRATIAADGHTFVEAEASRITVRDTYQDSDNEMQIKQIIARESLPSLGMAKYGHAVFAADRTVVVLTDAYTIAGIDIDALGEPH